MAFPGFITVKQGSSTNDARLLSPAVWAYCPGSALNSDNQGFFKADSFEGGTAGFAETQAALYTDGTFTVSTYASTVCSPDGSKPTDHALAIVTSSTAGKGYSALHSLPFGPIVPGGLGLWFEASVIPALSTQCGLFVGVTTAVGLQASVFSTGVFGDITGIVLGTVAMAGFVLNSTSTNYDAVYQSTAGVEVKVLSNVLTNSTAWPSPGGNPGNLNQNSPTTPGTIYASTAAMARFGLEYQPASNYLNWYVNGNLVCQIQPNSAFFETVLDFGGIVAVDGASNKVYVDYMGVASQLVK
jgi:hypothetical protein